MGSSFISVRSVHRDACWIFSKAKAMTEEEMYAFFVAVKMSNAARTNVDVRHLEAAEKLTFFGLEVQNMELPCDVKLPPATIIRKGCKMETFIRALKIRAGKEFELEFKS